MLWKRKRKDKDTIEMFYIFLGQLFKGTRTDTLSTDIDSFRRSINLNTYSLQYLGLTGVPGGFFPKRGV